MGMVLELCAGKLPRQGQHFKIVFKDFKARNHSHTVLAKKIILTRCWDIYSHI